MNRDRGFRTAVVMTTHLRTQVKPETTAFDAGADPSGAVPEARELALREIGKGLPRWGRCRAFERRAQLLTGLPGIHLHALPIHSICSESYRPVHAVFRNSLREIGYPDDRIITRFHDDSAFDSRGFRTPSWHFALREKIRYTLEQVRANPGRCIVVSDVDIQFFPPFARIDLGRILRERNLDLLFMRELSGQEPPVNAGFVAIRCGDAVIALLEAVSRRIDAEQLPFGDQTAFAEALGSGVHGVRFDTIGEEKVVWGTRCPGVISEAWFHHAVCCATGEEKLTQFEAVRTLRATGVRPLSAALRRLACRRKAAIRRIRSRLRQ